MYWEYCRLKSRKGFYYFVYLCALWVAGAARSVAN